MFITCQECNTTFRLDERLLKPTGSKVRCSQCLNTFTARPPVSPPTSVAEVAEVNASTANTAVQPDNAAEPEEHELEGIDLAELDAILEGDKTISASSDSSGDIQEADSAEELDELDLDFDFDSLEPEDMETSPAPPAAQEPTDELDLDMEFELKDEADAQKTETAPRPASPHGAAAPKSAPEKANEPEISIEDDLDLALEGLNLDSSKDDASRVKPQQSETKKTDELDLADLDFDLSDDDAEDEPSAHEEQELTLAEDTDFVLDEAPEPPQEEELTLDQLDLESDDMPPAAAGEPQGRVKAGEDLDLSDLDAMLDFSDNKSEKDTADEADLKLDDDLSLELDMTDDAKPESASGSGAEDELEDLEFELDSEFEDKPAGQGAQAVDEDHALSEDDEIDLSDIEEMLGSDAPPAAPVKEDLPADEDLGLEGDGGEIDLSEIEAAIDQAEGADSGPNILDEPELELELESKADAPSEDTSLSDELQLDLSSLEEEPAGEELDLDLDLELESQSTPDLELESQSTPQADSGNITSSDQEELDLSDLADLVDENKSGPKSEIVDGGDIELEFQIEEDEPLDTASAPSITTGNMSAATFEETMDAIADEEKPVPKAFKPKRKGSRKSLVVLFILIVLAGAGYGLYYAVNQMGIDIPYVSDYVKSVSDYLKPKPADPNGTLNLSTLDINSKFIENSQFGRLFVITGKVRNGYSTPRSAIRLRGKLFTKGKVLVKTEYSRAGILIGDQDLANLSIAQIKQRLNRNDIKTVQPGQEIPFMLVFSNLPPADQLDEFAVELVGSIPSPR